MIEFKKCLTKLVFILALVFSYGINISNLKAQVGINTGNAIDAGSALQIDSVDGALVPPRMSNAEMMAIATPIENGTILFNTTFSSYYIRSNNTWQVLTNPSLPAIVLNKDSGSLPTSAGISLPLPVGGTNVLTNNANYFTILGNGTIRILRSGTYIINAGFSISNLPGTARNYSLDVVSGGNLLGHLSKGNVDLPGNNYWGTSGSLIINAVANQEIEIKYFIDYNSTNLVARYINLGISKI